MKKDSAPFTLDWALDSAAVVGELEGKALNIEGYAADLSVDRQGDAFLPGAFEKGLQRYLDTNPILCYHHHYDQALGRVVDAKMDGKGLYVKAELDDPEPGTPLADVYRKVKSGTIRGFSMGGVFHRKKTSAGPRIHTCDIAEISVTPLPINSQTLFQVAGKAFGSEPDLDQAAASLALDSLEEAFASIRTSFNS